VSDRAMDWAMTKFRDDPDFRRRMWESKDKSAEVEQALREEMTRLQTAADTKEAPLSQADYTLTPRERDTINAQGWDNTANEDAMLAKIGQQGCAYT
jgi:hypothetical protein